MRPEIRFLLFASVIGGGLLLIFLWLLFSRATTPPPSLNIVPTATPVPNIFYNETTAKKVITMVKERPTPSPTDAQARDTLLAKIDYQTGTIYQSDTFMLMYLKTPDLFQAEILTSDVTKAKEDVQTWLISQGFSTEGVCHLPLTFYLSQDVSRVVYQANQSFNPLPLGC